MRGQTVVVFVGSCETFLDGRTVQDYIEELGLGDVLELKGHVERRVSLQYQMEASVLLLLIGIVEPKKAYTYGISGKVFDYLASERPILALAEDGASKSFLVEHGFAEVYSHSDEEGVSGYLVRAYRAWRSGSTVAHCPASQFAQFDCRALTSKLARYLAGSSQRR